MTKQNQNPWGQDFGRWRVLIEEAHVQARGQFGRAREAIEDARKMRRETSLARARLTQETVAERRAAEGDGRVLPPA
jgi:hypothetical protein